MIIRGDARHLPIRTGTVDCVVTSPPYLSQRLYGLDGREIGRDAALATYVQTIGDVFDECRRVMRPGAMAWLNIGDKANCVDDQTEALTTDGWKRYDQLAVGDQVLTLHPETRLAEWGEVLAVNVHDVVDEPMLELGGRGHSSLTTMNHRWYAERRTGRAATRRYVNEVVTSASLTSEHRIPTAAAVANLPTSSSWSDALVEGVAWYFTHGSDRQSARGGAEHGVYMRDEANADRIAACLTTLFGPAVDELANTVGPCWRNYPADDRASFRLNAAAARELRQHAPHRVPSMAWLITLTQAQLDLFVEVAIDANGTRTADGSVTFIQTDRARSEALQIAVILSGRAASLRQQVTGVTAGPNARPDAVPKPWWRVHVRHNTSLKPLRHPHQIINHTGIVWCPTTNNGSWLARRDGQVFFTGNSSGGAGGDWSKATRKARREGAGPGAFNDEAFAESTYLDVPGAVVQELLRRGWRLRMPIVWDKTRQAPESLQHVKRPRFQHEMIYLLTPTPRRRRLTDPGPRFFPSALEETGSVWRFPPGGNGDPHLAPFPDELARRCILPSTLPGDLVLDPFAGSGTVPRVAELYGRRGVGVELYAGRPDLINSVEHARSSRRLDERPSKHREPVIEIGPHDLMLVTSAPRLGWWAECECGWIGASRLTETGATASHGVHAEIATAKARA